MSDKLSDIEPCRFCGSKHVEVWSDAFVHCWACAADGPVCSSAQEAIAAWNRPTAPSPAGWKSVPMEATDEIIAALQKHCGVLLTDDMEINVGSRYTACEYALHCAWKEALAASPAPAIPAEPIEKNTPIDELVTSYQQDGFDFEDADRVKAAALRYAESMPDSHARALLFVLASAPAISESEDAEKDT